MQDYVIRATAGNGSIRAFAASTKNLVQHAREIHHTSPVASAALGRMLTAAAMMGSMLKGEKDLVTLQIRSLGPLKGIVVSGDAQCRVKGYVFNPSVDIPCKYPGKLDVSGAIGEGYLSVIKDIGLKEPYAGRIKLISGEIAEDLTYYYAQSEQVPSAVGLGVLVDTDTSIRQAGGFMIQLLPDATEEAISTLEQRLNTIPYMTDLLDMGKTPEDILEMILGDMDLKIMDKVPAEFYCNCTKERVEKALISIGKEELEKIINEDKKANLHCHFCSKEYDFTEEELRTLLESAK
ncbi:Hsp33 family molecular chaperone HslO [Anaerotignum lactatifermentans]|uniref:33 kDa chaperonin n=1 Tax=Anaerotignum lactatifermentans TaxID=160404 RepID=A0ABS2GAH4_9FIRM|nr:Hsp33 family molecular chaperone HslO [Anaerotignum lactatifermentans]MBM6828337.1 Hsp33 family molecular chaperone HslO [Anaerotignum lactatifermentans]MBM6877617.1 Hsp33 family molecular chaperone HslO [Anaerotignum lactatifermentans]MBM6949920.1 Hsp33 family molecular chaperone HslO [Anaerotignum lactatifermentans]